MNKLKHNLEGKHFGDWKVLEWVGGKRARWRCECICGQIEDVIGWNLVSSHTTRCDACRLESIWKHGHSNDPESGKPVTPTYSSWLAMKARCNNPKTVGYHRYGHIGIKVCNRWEKSFAAFLSDMGERPQDTTLERKNRKRGYSPSNCIWATIEVQANNRASNHLITIDRETKTIAQWCRVYGIGYACAFGRIKRGIAPKLAFSATANELRTNARRLTIDGVSKSVADWAREVGVRPGLIFCRLNMGWSDRDAVLKPKRSYPA